MGQSRVEDILEATIEAEPYTEEPQSRVEELLIELKETIEENPGGASDLVDLEDVSISQVNDGQVLKYNSQTSKWENKSDEGGTVVEANPQDEATTDLTKLKVANTTYGIPQGTEVEANPFGEGTADLTKLKVGNTIYDIPAGGTDVEANPTGTATDELDSIRIGNDIFSIPSGGGGHDRKTEIYEIFDTLAVSSRFAEGSLSGGFAFNMSEYDGTWSTSATAFNNTAIDLTDYDEIEIDVTINSQAEYGAFWVTLSGTKYTWDSSWWPTIYTNRNSSIKITESGTYTIDVSELSGDYYIYIGGTTGKDTTAAGDCNNGHNGAISGRVTNVYGVIKGSGGTNAEAMSLRDYNNLTPAQIVDGTIRFIPHTDVSEQTEIDMTTHGFYENPGNMNVADTSSTKTTITWGGGVQIGCSYYYTTPVDVTDWESIILDIHTGSCYGGGSTAQQPRWDFIVGLLDYEITAAVNLPASSSDWKVVADLANSNYDYSNTILDTSDLTGELYLTVVCHGWNATVENVRLVNAGGNPSQIKYMGETYGLVDNSKNGITELYSSDQRENTITLSESFRNYDYINLLAYHPTGPGYWVSTFYKTSELQNGQNIGIFDDATFMWYNITDDTTLAINNTGSNGYYIAKIYGINIGGGGEDKDKTVVYSLEHASTWESYANPNSSKPLILEVKANGVIDSWKFIPTELPSRDGGDYYVTVGVLPGKQTRINLAQGSNGNTLYISTDGSFDPSTEYVNVLRND